MMPDNNEIFLEFWQRHVWPEPEPLYLRAYHDDLGRVIMYSRENLPGAYLDITAEQFALADMRARVRDGELVPNFAPAVTKLVPSDRGTACHPWDVTIVTPDVKDAIFWRSKQHEED